MVLIREYMGLANIWCWLGNGADWVGIEHYVKFGYGILDSLVSTKSCVSVVNRL